MFYGRINAHVEVGVSGHAAASCQEVVLLGNSVSSSGRCHGTYDDSVWQFPASTVSSNGHTIPTSGLTMALPKKDIQIFYQSIYRTYCEGI